MSKIQTLARTYAMDLALTVRESLKDVYKIKETHYTPSGMRMIVTDQTVVGEMDYEILITPQPFMNPNRTEKDEE